MLKKLLLLGIFCFLLGACHAKKPFDTLDANEDQIKMLYSLGGTTSLGKKNAPITMVNVFAYDCSYCRKDFPLIEHFAKTHPDVRVIFKSFMAFGDKTNLLPQYAALAAAKQGQYLAMHHALMTTNRPLTSKTIHKIARELNLNLNKFDEDISSPAIAQQVKDNSLLMDQLHIDGIPTVVMTKTALAEDASKASDTPQYIQMGFISNDVLTGMMNQLENKKQR